MKYEILYDGRRIPVIGLGTWTMGGEEWKDSSRDNRCIEIIRKALEMGYTHIDTAEMYGSGHTEKLVGKAIEGFNRKELFLTSKVWSTNLRYKDVLLAFKGSLKRMKVDYIDLYLIHWPNPNIPMEETFKALNELIEKKLTKYIGVSNFNLGQLMEALKLSSTPIVTNQVEYSVICRGPEANGVLEYCQRNNILLTAWKPLGRRSILSNPTLIRIAEKYDVSPSQVAINWLVRQPGVITIPMSMQEKHLKENLDAAELEISQRDIDSIE